MAHILVVDDERSIRNTLKEILEFEKFTVDLAEDGPSGLAKIKDGSFDVILCDIKMPNMDGMEVLESALSSGVTTPIVIISGHGNIETAVEAIKKGAYDFYRETPRPQSYLSDAPQCARPLQFGSGNQNPQKENQADKGF